MSDLKKERITVDYALRTYTDNVLNCEHNDPEWYKARMSDDDFAEFIDLSPMIDILKAEDRLTQFEQLMKRLNAHMEEKQWGGEGRV